MNEQFKVGIAFGIKDAITGNPAHAIIVDGDTVLCTFHGTSAEQKCKAVCAVLNSAFELATLEKFDDLLH